MTEKVHFHVPVAVRAGQLLHSGSEPYKERAQLGFTGSLDQEQARIAGRDQIPLLGTDELGEPVGEPSIRRGATRHGDHAEERRQRVLGAPLNLRGEAFERHGAAHRRSDDGRVRGLVRRTRLAAPQAYEAMVPLLLFILANAMVETTLTGTIDPNYILAVLIAAAGAATYPIGA